MKRTAWCCWALVLAAIGGCREPAGTGGTSLTASVQVRPWTGESFNGRELTSTHYRIYTTTTAPEMVRYLPGFMEAAYTNYLSLTGLPDRPVPEPMPIYMMGTRQEWAALTRSVVGPQAELYLSIQCGGYCYRGVCVFWDMGGLHALSVAAHEGLHQFFAHRLKHQLPMWLEEGFCVLAEGYQIDRQTVRFTPRRNAARFNDLRNAIVHDRWIPLAELLPMDAGDAIQKFRFAEYVVGYYGQLWALAEFLRSDPYYRPRLARMLADAEAARFHEAMKLAPTVYGQLRQRGRLYNRMVAAPLFKHYIDGDLDRFERRYKAFARQLARLQ